LYGDPAGRHLIASGDLWNLDVAATGSNATRLVVQGETAILFVNDQYVATLDIAQHQAKGMIMVASGMFRDDEIIGESTPYTDFTIYSLDQ
jgi:hypothetical protein